MRKTKITYVNPAKGVFGEHDGWGTYNKDKFYKIPLPFGWLMCNKHNCRPSITCSEFFCQNIIICPKCEAEENYTRRREAAVADRNIGRKARLEIKKKAAVAFKALKECYVDVLGLENRENPFLALLKDTDKK